MRLFGRLLYTELQLKPNDALFQVVEKFPRYVAKYTHTSAPAKWIFLYKREAMVPLLVERKAADKEAIKLFFHEVSPCSPPSHAIWQWPSTIRRSPLPPTARLGAYF